MKKCRKLFCAVMALFLLLSGCTGQTAPSAEPTPTQTMQATGPLSLGDQIPDLSVTTVDGETLTLSELLQQKKMVLLNFWFADCIWCIREFPVMEVAYQQYKADAEIIALNPFDQMDRISAFTQEHSLSFPAASCSRDLTLALGISGYPTSVVIDREGRICLIHSGAITEKAVFDKLFETFTAADYTPRLYHSINEIL